MPHSNDQLKALNALQQKLQTAASWDAVHALLTPFANQYLAAESFLIVPTAEQRGDVWPIGGTGYALTFTPSPEASDLAELTAALLAACPFLQAYLPLSTDQQKLLEQISLAIVEQRPFDQITNQITAAFTNTFPGCRARLVLRDPGLKQLSLHTQFGEPSGWLPVNEDSNLVDVQETTLLPDDVQLVLPVKTAVDEVRAFLKVTGSSVEE